MASTTKNPPLQVSLALTVLLSLAISATARPCQTLLISYYPYSLPPRLHSSDPSSSGLVTIFTDIKDVRPVRLNPAYVEHNDGEEPIFSTLFLDRSFPTFEKDRIIENRNGREEDEPSSPSFSSSLFEPFGLSSHDFISFRDHTKDILSVVVALLFGVGCGALTAAFMYFVWSLFSDRYEYRGPYDGFVDDDHEMEGLKQIEYVQIPAVESVAATPQAKEVV